MRTLPGTRTHAQKHRGLPNSDGIIHERSRSERRIGDAAVDWKASGAIPCTGRKRATRHVLWRSRRGLGRSVVRTRSKFLHGGHSVLEFLLFLFFVGEGKARWSGAEWLAWSRDKGRERGGKRREGSRASRGRAGNFAFGRRKKHASCVTGCRRQQAKGKKVGLRAGV
jgi:hypothetical protein